MHFRAAALLPIALAAVASSAPVSIDNRGFGDFVSDHINGIQDIAAGTVGGLAGAVGGPAGIVEGAGAGVTLSNTIQSHTRRSAADATVEAIKSLERREDLTPAERGIIDFVKDHSNGIQDIAYGTVGGLAGLEAGPVGVAGGIATGVGISDSLQERRRGLIDYVKDHANGLEDIAAGTAGGIAGAVYGGPIGAVAGVSGGVKASDELQSHTRRNVPVGAQVAAEDIRIATPIIKPTLIKPTLVRDPINAAPNVLPNVDYLPFWEQVKA